SLPAKAGQARIVAQRRKSMPPKPAKKSSLAKHRRHAARPTPRRRSPAIPRHRIAPPAPAREETNSACVPDLERHARKCVICNHPDREAIEDEFINWRIQVRICQDYHLPYGAGIYRHAKATGPLERRRRNLRGVAERILERADAIHPTAEAILSAMRIYAHITEDGRWIEPPKRTVVHHIHSFAPRPPSPENSAPQKSSATSETSSPQLPASVPASFEDSSREILIDISKTTREAAND
ncbi:MAG: hypothetical protein WBE87_11860, partial [Candidatus Acidiferrales bacterium]